MPALGSLVDGNTTGCCPLVLVLGVAGLALAVECEFDCELEPPVGTEPVLEGNAMESTMGQNMDYVRFRCTLVFAKIQRQTT